MKQGGSHLGPDSRGRSDMEQQSRRRTSSWEDEDSWADIDWQQETEEPQPRRETRRSYEDYEQSRSGRSRAQTGRTPSQAGRSQSQSGRAPSQTGRTQSRSGSAGQRSYEDYERSRGGGQGLSYEQARAAHSRSRRQKRSVPLIVVAVVLVIGMVIAGWQLISILLNYQRDRSAYDELAANAISSLADGDEDADDQTDDGTAATDTTDANTAPIIVDWDYLESINTDIVGWIYCPDTVINYPVVQASDNSYYLKHGFDKQSNTSGTLFADVSSVVGINMCNFIIYGHNMKDGSMFGTLEGYVDQSYYEEHPIMYYLTPTATYRIDLIAAHIVESTLDNYPGYFDSTSDYQTYLNQLTSASLFSTNATVSTDYQLITLSTCDYSSSYDDPRFLVHGLLVPID